MNKDELLKLISNAEIRLSPSQKRISIPIVVRIYKKMKKGLMFNSIQVAKKTIIVDGHHRYLASLLANMKLEMVEYPLTSAKKMTHWELVEFVDEDWDTPEEIKRFNEQDARYNGMTLEALMELIA